MYRVLPAPRQVAFRAGGTIRVARRRFATEAPVTPPKKKKGVFRRLILYSTAATAAFYGGSVFVAFNNEQYYDFFVEQIPFGAFSIEYAEDHGWDTTNVNELVNYGKKQIEWVQRKISGATSETADKVEKTKGTVNEKAHPVASAVAEKAKETQERLKALTEKAKTAIHKSEERLIGGTKTANATVKHQTDQFSRELDVLIKKAEAALAGKPIDSLPETTTSPEQPAGAPPDTAPRDNEDPDHVYTLPLPLGFEPPPGYSRPYKPKKAEEPQKPKDGKSEPAFEPLPLIAPAVSELGVSEPVLSHLASTIDNLAAYLNSNPDAATKAKDVLDTAKVDLTELASHLEKVKEEERKQLEAKLDEQTRVYTTKLLEMELEAQDKLDTQEDGFKKWFEEERTKFVRAYREKLDRELQTQSELINERLKEEVIAQGIELQRRWIREIKVRVEQERGGRLAKLDELSANLKRLERVALDNSAYLDENLRIHAMWSALRALNGAVESPVRKPFREELRVLRHVAVAREDPVVSAALDSLESSDVPDVGVEPLADLATWFTTSVAPKVSRAALVPDQGTPGLLSHLASHFLSSFRFRREGLVPGSDVLSVLARAEYYLNEKDLDSAARELNQLKGTAKVLLADWLQAARQRLEVTQTLDVVQTEATLASLLVI